MGRRALATLAMTSLLTVSMVPAAEAADQTIYVRHSALECGSLSPCETSLNAAFSAIFFSIGSVDHTLLDVGPGVFPVSYSASFVDVTLRGSGVGTTTIVPASAELVFSSLSDQVEVADLRVDGRVTWYGSGSSTWTNVDLRGRANAWRQPQTCNGGSHTFRYVTASSNASAADTATFLLRCGTILIEASEVRVVGNGLSGGSVTRAAGLEVRGDASVTVSGVPIRVPVAPLFSTVFDESVSAGLYGARVLETGTLALQGGIVNVDGSDVPGGANVTAIYRAPGSDSVTTSGTAFIVRTTAGVARRLEGDPVQSLFLWPQSASPPGGATFSQTGQDQFVETDCGCNGSCNQGGSEPHLMQFDASCSDGWRDQVTGSCRNTTVTCP